MKLLFVELITIYNNLKHQKIYNKTCNVYVFLLKTKAMINAQNLTIKKNNYLDIILLCTEFWPFGPRLILCNNGVVPLLPNIRGR